jgi:hypothetical protein
MLLFVIPIPYRKCVYIEFYWHFYYTTFFSYAFYAWNIQLYVEHKYVPELCILVSIYVNEQ